MNLLDLYENREPYQQAIDKLEQRRIADLEARMDDCARRGDVAGFRKAKEERDSYHKVKTNEGEMKRAMHADAERMSREAFCKKYGNEDWVCEFWDNVNGPLDEAGIGQDIVNKQEKMARATPSTPAGKVASTVKNAAKWLAGKGGPGKEGPTYEGVEDDVEAFLKAGGKITYGKPQKGPRRPGMSLASRHIGGGGDRMKPSRSGRGASTQGKPVVSTEDSQKKNSEKVGEDSKPRDLTAALMLKKAHAAFPIAKDDAEALALWIADKEARDVARLERENEQEEEMIARIVDQLKSKEVDEGWSDRIVAQRTGRPRTPYSIYIKGRKWKDFENEDHAEAVANKLKAKFKAEGRDPSVITIAPTDYDKGVDEAANPAQQAAIAIAMKKAGKKPKHTDESATAPIIVPKRKAKKKPEMAIPPAQDKSKNPEDDKYSYEWYRKQGVTEDTGSWIVYDPETKQIKKRFKTHTAGKSYAQTHRLGFASSEYYFDNIKPAVTAEAVSDKTVKKLQGLFKQAKAGKLKSDGRKPGDNWTGPKPGEGAHAAGHGMTGDSMKEAQTDYSKRRQRERDIDAGKPVAKQRTSKQTDYQKRRAQDKKDMELGEGATISDKDVTDLIHDIAVDLIFNKQKMSIRDTNPTLIAKEVKQAYKMEGMPFTQNDLDRVLSIFPKVMSRLRKGFAPEVKDIGEEKTRLDPKCWKGKKIGNPKTKMKGGVRVNNCVPAEESMFSTLGEDQDTSGVESAIIRRIMVAHLDWLQKFGPEKVMQAAEEVAYNVGDVDEIGTSDVSAYVHEVGQILGA